MQSKEFTLIIHGPLSIYTVFSLYRYRDTFPIVISIPRPQDDSHDKFLTEIQEMVKDKNTNISLLIYDPNWKESYNNEQNRYSHFFSVQLALQACSTPYAIKMRSDEFYSNLSPIVNAVKKHKTKLITNEVFFRNAVIPFHPSDHLVAGGVEMMLETFATAKLLCENNLTSTTAHLLKYTKEKNNTLYTKFHIENGWLAAEQHFALGAIASQSAPNKLKDPDHVPLMKEIFHIVPCSELGLFRVRVNSGKGGPTEFFDTSFFKEDLDVDDMENYEV